MCNYDRICRLWRADTDDPLNVVWAKERTQACEEVARSRVAGQARRALPVQAPAHNRLPILLTGIEDRG